ncbi:Chemotaxis protein CheA [Planctomyces bekefii]|uniref:Chemotaxis protein CheA n=1 Tax=Planctomyces bekefii TaxID=1653850 RepID=A0A5C6M5B6_9PLAN|nr:Chemotaxis protein CheA [Planctomyces bekefii]
MLNEENFTSELQSVFLTEAQELLEDTEAAVLEVEQNPSDIAKIDKIFRVVHTIKGSAHVDGFSDLGAFAHSFESLLGALRDRVLAVTPDVVDVLLLGSDILKKFVDVLREDRSATIDTSQALVRISAALNKGGPEAKSVAASKSEVTAKVVETGVSPGPIAHQVPQKASNTTSASGVTAVHSKERARRVLVLDDDQDILEMLVDILDDAGYRVFKAQDGREALAVMKKEAVDFIMTDLKMPHMN